jgi:hypothetical protein
LDINLTISKVNCFLRSRKKTILAYRLWFSGNHCTSLADLCQAVKLRLVRHIYLARYRMVLGNGRRKLSAAWTDVVMATDGAKIVGKAERTNVEEFDRAKLNAFRRQHDLRL